VKIFNLADIFEQPVAPAEVQPSVYFYFFGKIFEKLYSFKQRHRKMGSHFAAIRLIIFYMSVYLSDTHFW
jgi:hypothetical protein